MAYTGYTSIKRDRTFNVPTQRKAFGFGDSAVRKPASVLDTLDELLGTEPELIAPAALSEPESDLYYVEAPELDEISYLDEDSVYLPELDEAGVIADPLAGNPFFRSAVLHARAGWEIIWLPEGGKNPKESMKGGWGKKGTRNEAVLREWWTGNPRANVGLLPQHDTWVLDVDCKFGAKGLVDLDELTAEFGGFPATPFSISPSGGRHYHFKRQPGFNPRKAAAALKARLGHTPDWDIKVRTEQHVIVAPGSVLTAVPDKTIAGTYVWGWLPNKLVQHMTAEDTFLVAEGFQNFCGRGIPSVRIFSDTPQWLMDLMHDDQAAKPVANSHHSTSQGGGKDLTGARLQRASMVSTSALPAAAVHLMSTGDLSRTASQDANAVHTILKNAGHNTHQIQSVMSDPQWTRLREHYSKEMHSEAAIVARIHLDVERLDRKYRAPVGDAEAAHRALREVRVAMTQPESMSHWSGVRGGSARHLLGVMVEVGINDRHHTTVRLSKRQGATLAGLSDRGFMTARDHLISKGWLLQVSDAAQAKEDGVGVEYSIQIPAAVLAATSTEHSETEDTADFRVQAIIDLDPRAAAAFVHGGLGQQGRRVLEKLLEDRELTNVSIADALGICRSTVKRIRDKLSFALLLDTDEQLAQWLVTYALEKGLAYRVAKRALQMSTQTKKFQQKRSDDLVIRDLEYIADMSIELPVEEMISEALEEFPQVSRDEVVVEAGETWVRLDFETWLNPSTGETKAQMAFELQLQAEQEAFDASLAHLLPQAFEGSLDRLVAELTEA